MLNPVTLMIHGALPGSQGRKASQPPILEAHQDHRHVVTA